MPRPAAPTARPALKGDTRERINVAESTRADPLYTIVRPASEYALAWAAKGREFELSTKGYRPVRPEELQLMEGGQHMPDAADFGCYFWFDKTAPTVEQGQHVLFKIPKKLRDERLTEQANTMARLKPKKEDDSIEKANLQEGAVTTVAGELGED